MAFNAAAAYQGSKINTATPAELTLMLYDGAIKFCNIALIGIEEKDVAKANLNIVKAEKIITELRATLDFKYSIAKEFDVVYDYVYRRLVEANIRKDKDIIEEVLEHIRGMRDTWKDVIKVARAKQ